MIALNGIGFVPALSLSRRSAEAPPSRHRGPQEVLAFALSSASSANAFVSGRVVEQSGGAPIVGATVTIDVGGFTQSGLSNEDGVYLLPAVAGAFSGSVEAAGYGVGVLSGLAVFGHTTQIEDLALAAVVAPVQVGFAGSSTAGASAIQGRVLDSATGVPIAGAAVEIEIAGQRQSGVTNALGEYLFNTPSGALSGSIRVPGYNEAVISLVVAAAGRVMADYVASALTGRLDRAASHSLQIFCSFGITSRANRRRFRSASGYGMPA
jgi:hypothetical protein